MAFSRTAPRHELTYLRRRPKPGEAVAAPRPATATRPPALSLGRTEAPEQAPAAKVRRVDGRAILTLDAPVVTLDRRQAAIGALAFELVGTGALGCAWELAGGEGGLVSAQSGARESPQFGRRAIVELHEQRIVVGLRHVRELRRLLLLAGGLDAQRPSRLVGELLDEGTIESAHAGVAPVLAALAVYQVDGELVVRREGYGFATEEEAAAAYGFALTWLPPIER